MSSVLILANNDVGLYRFRKELLKKLIDTGYEVYISLPNGDLVESLVDLGCKFIETPIDRRGTNPVKDLKLVFQYRKIIKNIQPDVVLTYTVKPNVYGGIVCSLKKVPYIVNVTGLGTSIENPGLMQKLTLFLYRKGLKKASTVFFQNKTNAEFFKNIGIVKDNYQLLPGSGVNLIDNCYEEYPKDGKIKFLFIGRIMKDKGIEEYLECAKVIKAKYQNVEFSIIGDYDEPKYVDIIKDLHEKNIVNYYGMQKDVHSFIKEHHAVVLPSYHEGLSNVLLEAASSARPVLASNVPGCIETFDDEVSGLSFKVKDAKDLIRAVEQFMSLSYEQKKEMGLNGRAKIEKEYDRNIVINKYLNAINHNSEAGEINMELYENIVNGTEKLSLVGLGYVGMPIAVAFSKKVKVIGFDLNESKIELYKQGIDPTNEVGNDAIKNCSVDFTADETKLREAKFHIVAVPTPVNDDHTPDLSPVEGASRIVGRNLTKGSIVVYESTVYPGVTEEICVPILEKESGLKCGVDFKVGYSPERINPGDKVHRLETIIKIVSGMDEETLDTVAKVYELVVEAGVHRAQSIKVAEAAKVIENSQRDINIAFMNELSIIFNKMGIDTQSVLEAAGTKWNFLNFYPGLVGGHCIGVDPYYLTYKAEEMGYHSQIILSGRRINDDMGKYVAENVVKNLIKADASIKNAKVAVLGFTFKENCPDTRNTKIIDIYNELKEYGITAQIVDPVADCCEAKKLYGIDFVDINEISDCDAVILAVAHEGFKSFNQTDFDKMFKSQENSKKVLVDIKGLLNRKEYETAGYNYWRL